MIQDRWFTRGDWIRYEGKDYIFICYCEEERPQNTHGYVRLGDDPEDWDQEHVEFLDLAEFICKPDDLRFFVGNHI